MKKKLHVGKLNMEMLKDLLGRYTEVDERVVLGPGIGEDAAVIDFGEKYLVAKTDPITFATEEIGWYLVHINANDIACSGAVPRWLLVAILLPQEAATKDMVDKIFSQISEACRSIGVILVGGHTEVTQGLSRPIVVGHMLGEVDKERLVTSSGGKPGDEILLPKGIAIEGVALLAREKEAYLLQRGYDKEFIERCKSFIYHPGISVLEEAVIASRTTKVTTMHDPTEGGLAMGVAELAEASGVGAEIYLDKVKVYEECKVLCEEFSIDPLGVIASGSLLITASPENARILRKEFEKRNLDCACIGRFVKGKKKLDIVTPQGKRP
ncbi:MAG: AIR synthase family protein, partial [Planctomycetota bacterium]